MATKVLPAPPSLGPLFAKAALTGPLHRGKSLPDTVVELPERSIDAAQLAAYDKVCRFRYSDTLPPTYLHILAFPLSVQLMTERSFPFPLVGLVHVANSITVNRPVSVAEKVAFAVEAADLRPHPAGRQFDLVAVATVGDEEVWTSRSTYLRRGGGSGEREPKQPNEPITGPSSQVRVPDDIGRRYAAVSGDSNPIHMHSLSAKAFGFKSAIAHGMWLKARTLATLEGRLPDGYRVDVQFKTPVFLPSTVSIAAIPHAHGWDLDVRNARSGKPHLTGTVTAL